MTVSGKRGSWWSKVKKRDGTGLAATKKLLQLWKYYYGSKWHALGACKVRITG